MIEYRSVTAENPLCFFAKPRDLWLTIRVIKNSPPTLQMDYSWKNAVSFKRKTGKLHINTVIANNQQEKYDYRGSKKIWFHISFYVFDVYFVFTKIKIAFTNQYNCCNQHHILIGKLLLDINDWITEVGKSRGILIIDWHYRHNLWSFTTMNYNLDFISYMFHNVIIHQL